MIWAQSALIFLGCVENAALIKKAKTKKKLRCAEGEKRGKKKAWRRKKNDGDNDDRVRVKEDETILLLH